MGFAMDAGGSSEDGTVARQTGDVVASLEEEKEPLKRGIRKGD